MKKTWSPEWIAWRHGLAMEGRRRSRAGLDSRSAQNLRWQYRAPETIAVLDQRYGEARAVVVPELVRMLQSSIEITRQVQRDVHWWNR